MEQNENEFDLLVRTHQTTLAWHVLNHLRRKSGTLNVAKGEYTVFGTYRQCGIEYKIAAIKPFRVPSPLAPSTPTMTDT